MEQDVMDRMVTVLSTIALELAKIRELHERGMKMSEEALRKSFEFQDLAKDMMGDISG